MPNWSLIAKYIKRESLTPEEKGYVETWIAEDQANERTFGRLQKVISPDHAAVDFKGNMEEDWAKIMEAASAEKTLRIASFPVRPITVLKIAASFLLLCLLGLALVKNNLFREPQKFISLDSVKQVQLADGSTIWLNKNSSLVLEDYFGKSNRNVTLTGEAYFEIARDTANTFTVHTGNVQTQVLGTTFNISNQAHGNVIVTVQEGKVSVSTSDSEVFLTKDEVAVYAAREKHLQKDQNTNANYMSWKTGIIRFSATPITDACAILSRHYGINVQSSETIKGYSITSVLDNLTFDQAINIVALTLDLRIEKKDDSVVLSK